jgi:peroxiredoxin
MSSTSTDFSSLRLPPARPVDEGDSAPYIRTLDHDGKPAGSDADLIAGKPVLLLFCPAPDNEAVSGGLAEFRGAAERIAAAPATLFIIVRADAPACTALRERLALPFALLPDPQGNIFKAYGVDPAPAVPGLTVFALDSGHRVGRVLDRLSAADLAAKAMEELAHLIAAKPTDRVRSHAPVLVLPRMLTPTDCELLAAIWQRPVPEYATDGFKNEGTSKEKGDFKIVHDGVYGRAVEYIVQEPGLQRYIDGKMRRRLLPEIKKAFQMAGLKREGYRIAGYESRDGGYLNPHRDNSTPANAHRKFTMTINLNAGQYEGGELRFREYGDHLYAVERGTAIVWSASLLHEVMPVTKGRRLVLGVHMYADAAPRG